MKFGASSYIWVSPFSNDTLSYLGKAKEMGFDIFEICIEDPTTIDVSAIKAESEKVGIDILICGAFGPDRDISSEDSAIRQHGVDYIKTCIDISNDVGSPIFSGPMYSATGKARLLSDEDRNKQWDWAVENMKVCAEYASDKGVKLAIEVLNRFETDFINTVDQAMDFLARIDKENVGLLLDTFHMNIEEKKPGDAIRKAGNKVFHFHSCENDRGTPGTGSIDWSEIARALKDINYNDAAVIESFNKGIVEIAKAVSLWRPIAPSQDGLASEGLAFLKGQFS